MIALRWIVALVSLEVAFAIGEIRAGVVWEQIAIQRESESYDMGARDGYNKARAEMRVSEGPIIPGNCAPSNTPSPCLFGEK